MIAAVTARAAASPGALWYLTRGTGVVSLLLLTASVALGIVATIGLSGRGWPRFLTTALHRAISLLSLSFIAVHIATTVADSFAPIGVLDAFLPFASAYRPVWLGLGTLAFDLLLAVALTSLLRDRLGYRRWRIVHWLAYASWPVALVHVLGTGSDTRAWWLDAVAIGSTLIVVGAIGWRLVTARAGRPDVRVAFAALAVVAPIAVLIWWTGGPGAPGWAARAGTPSSLLAHAAPAPAVRRKAPAPARVVLPKPRFSATFHGTLDQTQPNDSGTVTLTIAGHTTGGAATVLRISIRGVPSGGGGVSMTASRVQLGRSARELLYQGPVTSLQGTDLTASLTAAAGPPIDLTIHLNIAATGNAVTGSVQARPGAAAGRGRA